MSLCTLSGLPAHCPNTIEKATAQYNEFMKGIEHLRDCADFNLLFIPKVEDFLKFDIRNDCHPMHHEILKQQSAREYDEDELTCAKAQFTNGIISEETYEMQIQEKRVRELKRRAVFDKSDAFKKQLLFEVDVLKQMGAINEQMNIKENGPIMPEVEDAGRLLEGTDLHDSESSD